MSFDTQWFYGSGNERRGPYSRDQLMPLIEAGAVDGQTLVWSEGMGDWQPLASTPLAVGLSAQQLAPKPNVMGSMAFAGGYGTIGAPPMNFGEAIKSGLSKIVTFSGRASRSEYWYFYLFLFLCSVLLQLVDFALFSDAVAQGFSPLANIFGVVSLLPLVSVGARRLHDTDRSAWWLLLYFAIVIGWIVLLVFYCQRGTPGRNRFG